MLLPRMRHLEQEELWVILRGFAPYNLTIFCVYAGEVGTKAEGVAVAPGKELSSETVMFAAGFICFVRGVWKWVND